MVCPPSRTASRYQVCGGTAVSDLTAREREIAELASDGLTSSEIGRRLFLSTRTVDSHLGHVYAKLSVANRTALAAVLRAARDDGVRTPAATDADGLGRPARVASTRVADLGREPRAGVKAPPAL